MGIFILNKKEIITSIFALLCLAGYVFFPSNGYFQYRAVAIVFLILLPFLYNKYFLKEKTLFGRIAIGDWKSNLKYLSIGLLGAFMVIAIVFKYTGLAQHYFLSTAVSNNFGSFLMYEFTGVLLTVALYEIFFRGFILFKFSSFEKWAILVQVLFFLAMILMFFNLPYWFYINYLVFAPFAGWIAYKSNSILYSFVGQLLFIVIIDATFIALVVKG